MICSDTLGVELEMVVIDASNGHSHCVDGFFSQLHAIKLAQQQDAQLKVAASGQVYAVQSARGNTSIDNAFNNIECAIGPIGLDCLPQGLQRLNRAIHQELNEVLCALEEEGATIANFSQHPALRIDEALYRRIRAPKPIYDYWVDCRGWDHKVGIDAKAQNSPSYGVSVARAVPSLNAMLAAAPALIALFANSPFENGQVTGLQENRLTIWPRMFKHACCPADRWLSCARERPFVDMRDYFDWMFGDHTCMQIVPYAQTFTPKGKASVYKELSDTAQVLGQPCLLDFLRGRSWPSRRLGSASAVLIEPSMAHFAFQQFAQFLDARIRFGFAREPSIEEFFAAWDSNSGIERLFESTFAYCYIEGRAPGANFPDHQILEQAGLQVAASMMISPSAIQAGLLRNAAEVDAWVECYPWKKLPALRMAAVHDGLSGKAAGETVRALCEQVLTLAENGLDPEERWMLAYPQYVLKTGINGAQRALQSYANLYGSSAERLFRVLQKRKIVSLDAISAF